MRAPDPVLRPPVHKKGKGFNGGKSDWEGTFAGPHGNDEDTPSADPALLRFG